MSGSTPNTNGSSGHEKGLVNLLGPALWRPIVLIGLICRPPAVRDLRPTQIWKFLQRRRWRSLELTGMLTPTWQRSRWPFTMLRTRCSLSLRLVDLNRTLFTFTCSTKITSLYCLVVDSEDGSGYVWGWKICGEQHQGVFVNTQMLQKGTFGSPDDQFSLIFWINNWIYL